MDRILSPAEKRSVLRPRRTKLEQFPCALELTATNMEYWIVGCADDCSIADICPARDIYEQAIADHRCARVLLRLKVSWWDKHYWPDIFTGQSGDHGSMWIARFRELMNAALREAGL